MLRRLAGRVLDALLWLAIALAASMLVPMLLGFRPYVISSGSMEGEFSRGAVIYTWDEPVSELEVGDVITYQPPPSTHLDEPVSHRIVWAGRAPGGERAFQTKGDANEAADPWRFTLDKEEQAVYRFQIPLIGYLWALLQLPKARFLLIGVPALLVAVGIIGMLVRDARRPLQPPGGAAAGAAAMLLVAAMAGAALWAPLAWGVFEQRATTISPLSAADAPPPPSRPVSLYSKESDPQGGDYAVRNGTTTPAATGKDDTLTVHLGDWGCDQDNRRVERVFRVRTANPLPAGVNEVRVRVEVATQPSGYTLLLGPDIGGASDQPLRAGQETWVAISFRTRDAPPNRLLQGTLKVTVSGLPDGALTYTVPVSVQTAPAGSGGCRV